MSTEQTVVEFTLTSSDYTDLWLRLKNKDGGNTTLNLVEKLMHDHSNILKEIILYPHIKIVWSDGIGQDINWDETYGKEDKAK
jgi:hypothetical protein